jgi:hypothetical protein
MEVRGNPTIIEIDAAASTTFYKGGLYCWQADGYVGQPANGLSFAGVCAEQAVIGTSGRVRLMDQAIFLMTFASIAIANVGDLVYVTAADNSLATQTGLNNSLVCGKIVEYVSATQAWVDTRIRVA